MLSRIFALSVGIPTVWIYCRTAGQKAEGIKKLINKLGFQMEDVYAFGDGLNDMEMLGEVGTGVAMGNAPDAVKKKAVYVTKSVSDNGIWHGLKELKLI